MRLLPEAQPVKREAPHAALTAAFAAMAAMTAARPLAKLPSIPPTAYGPPDKIKLLAEGLDVAPLAAALAAHPELWNLRTARTAPSDSPHHGVDDIWARFCGPGESGAAPHESSWYTEADCLPLRRMAEAIMDAVGGSVLGGVLITRIPPGARVRPHVDRGWHAEFFSKFAVQVAAAPGQAFYFEDQVLETKPGDLFTFTNQHLHWVRNPTPYERVTAIFCIRVDRGGAQ